MENNHPRLHAIMFPLPYQGHVTPCINLAMKLASKGFTITFVNTEFIHHQITNSLQSEGDGDGHNDIFTKARDSGFDIRYRTMSDGFPLDFNRMVNQAKIAERNFLGFPTHVDELVGNLVKSDPSISCLIADTFYTWPSQIAHKYKLVSISFWTQPALVFNLFYHMDLLITNGQLASHDNLEDTIDYIPGVKTIKSKDLPSFLQETNKWALEFLDKVFKEAKNVDFILSNTIQELESETILFIQEEIKPIFAIGPLGLTKSTVPTSLKTEVDCIHWLNTKPHGSVLYISFGSFLPSKKCDIDEIAHGLVLSGVNFIWVLRHDVVSYEESYVLPIGFGDEIKEKGLIVPWCNQVEVISHPSVGGFLTHCGWNSLLESLRYSNGIPLLCFPLEGDQITNRKLVVDDWRIGLNLCDRKPLTRSEVAEKIKYLMSGKLEGDDLREQVIKMSQKIRNALAKDGSSEKNLDHFIADVEVKIGEPTYLTNSNNRL